MLAAPPRVLLEVHMPPAGEGLADLLPGEDVLPHLDRRHEVRVVEVAEEHGAVEDPLAERGRTPGVIDPPHGSAFDGEDRVGTRGIVGDDVDRLVVADGGPRHRRRPACGRVQEGAVDAVRTVPGPQGPALVVVLVRRRELERPANRGHSRPLSTV